MIKSVVFAAVVAVVAGCERGPLTLARRGEAPKYSIVVPREARESCRFAAEELQTFLRRITGAELPIEINTTPKRGIYLSIDKESADDAFKLATRERSLYITGGKRGVIYGVYEVLERFGGVGWFSSWRETVPEAASFTVPETLAETHKPCFRLRQTTWEDARLVSAEFTTRLRLNGSALPEKFGGQECKFAPTLGNCHTFERLVPQKKYFKNHPEYYSEVNGVRRHGQTQLCLTNPDVLKIVVDTVLEVVRKHPEAQVVGISQNDWAYYCECAMCKAIDDEEGSPAGSLVRFLNKVAERVCKVHPKLQIETLAYQYTRKPPKKTKLHPNVMPCLCSIECDFSRPLYAKGKENNERFLADIEGWAKLTDNLYLWDYTTDYRHYLHPYPNVPVLQDNLRYFRDHGVRFMFEEGASFHCDLAEFKSYLLAKWMWNPEIPYAELEAKFLKGYYGAAAPYAKKYLERYFECCKREVNHNFSCFAFDCPAMFDDEFIDWSLANWNEAEKAVRDDAGGLYAVRAAKLVPLVTKLDRWVAENPRVWVTRSPEKYRIPVAEVKKTYEEAKNIFDEIKVFRKGKEATCGNLKVRQELPPRNWKTLFTQKIPTGPTDRAVVSFREFDNWNEARGDVAKDEGSLSEAKKAVKVYNYTNAMCVYFNLKNLAFDEEGTYRVRVRARAVRAENGKGEAFQMRLGSAFLGVKAEELKDDAYQWYELGEMKLKRDWRFEFGNGRYSAGGGSRAVKESWVDLLEFTRVK